jgi:hypothetical protein
MSLILIQFFSSFVTNIGIKKWLMEIYEWKLIRKRNAEVQISAIENPYLMAEKRMVDVTIVD